MRAALPLALVALSCNTYDPGLGDVPFRCGTDEPRCPSGYVAVDVSAIRCECQRGSSRPDGGGEYFCNFDPGDSEGSRNDSPTAATELDVELNPVQNLIDRSICPAGDEDHYKLMAPREGTRIFVRVVHDRTRLAPGIDIGNEQGASLMPARATPELGVVTAEYVTTFGGSFVIKVFAPEEINYSLRLEVTPPG
jgi:hypothetical protein